MKTFIFLLVLCAKNLRAQDEDGVLCSVTFCSTYISENPCPDLPDNCNIQNSTHNGVFLPSPDPCNCCQYCLVNLKENDYCAEGEEGGIVPDSICGPGLTCSNGVCVKMSDVKKTPCTTAQAEYDDRRNTGNSGNLEIRPNCDGSGDYEPYKCVLGQTCFCVSKEGKRIFGEIPYTKNANWDLKCECSRKYEDALKLFGATELHPDRYFRCTENGDYDTIQCIGDNCMCTDAFDGAPTFPTFPTVNISEISEETLGTCVKKGVHLEGKYYYECAQKYLDILTEIEGYKDQGFVTVFEIEFPSCTPDGKYAPVQKHVTNPNAYYCAKSDGSPIENYIGTNTAEDPMDCKCAKSRLLIDENAFEKPECCLNGNFNPVQCRRGTCYCVDSDGYQDIADGKIEAPEAEKETLFCYTQASQEKCLGKTEL